MENKKLLATFGNVEKFREVLSNGVTLSPEDIANLYSTDDYGTANLHVTFGRGAVSCLVRGINIGKTGNIITRNSEVEMEDSVRNEILNSTSASSIYPLMSARKYILSITESTRKMLKKMCIGGSSLIDAKSFETFLEFYAKKKKELESVVESYIIDIYEDEMQNFQKVMESIYPTIKDDTEISRIKRCVNDVVSLTPDEIRNGIKMVLETDFKDDKISAGEFESLFEEAKKAFVENKGLAIIRGVLKELWSICSSFLIPIQRCMDNNLTSGNFALLRKKMAERTAKVKRQNFRALEFIDGICDMLTNISEIEDKEDAEDELACAMALIYSECEKMDEELSFKNFPDYFSPESLKNVYESRFANQ